MKKRHSKHSRKPEEQNVRRLIKSLHTLIAVVAIIECMLLLVFSTYSWIETNSSLIIKNGPAFNDTDQISSLHIADKLKYKVNLTTDETNPEWAALNEYFSQVKYFEFAKTTSPNGTKFFFPRGNNTYVNATAYRSGDTIDYNTSYLYFDFVLANSTNENFNVYFDNTFDEDIFTVAGGSFSDDAEENEEYKGALRKAMRMSITTKVGNTESTNIYAYNGASNDVVTYDTLAPDTSENALLNPSLNYEATANSIKKYVFAQSGNVITSDRLFIARKNVETRVSIRVWFELNDPSFINKFGTNYESATYKKIPSADIGVKFRLKTSLNDLRVLNFDDYTFSTQSDATHLTDENADSNYSVWFYAFQPQVAAAGARPARQASWIAVPLVRDNSYSKYARWTTQETTDSMMNWLRGSTDVSNTGSGYNGTDRYTKCFFCYGDYETKAAKYCWQLTAAPAADNGEYVYNAYSFDPSSSYDTAVSGARTGTWKRGVGIWDDDLNYSSMTLLKLNDLTTAVTSGNYNASVSGSPNEKFMNAKAQSASNSYLVYANNVNSFTDADQTVTLDGGVTTTIHASSQGINSITAAMYYDSDAEIFKSYVPTYWLTGDGSSANKGVSFTYSPSGVFNQAKAAMRWYNATPQSSPSNGYVYSALGYTKLYNDNSYLAESSVDTDTLFFGIGTWGAVEKLSFSTELIDANLDTAYRYMIGISGYSPSNAPWDYYAMIPDETNMTFSAYVPKDIGKEGAAISFARYASDHTQTACWFANTRYSYKTFYPVDLNGTYKASGYSASDYTHGYWNVSVLVDGTYENLIYDTLTDGETVANQGNVYMSSAVIESATAANMKSIDFSTRKNYGKLEYSYTGQDNTWITICDDLSDSHANMIDRYRFYAPAENHATVYWRWTPYAGYSITVDPEGENITTDYDATVFEFTHNTANGIYKLVTEAQNTITATSGQQGQHNAPAATGARIIDVIDDSEEPDAVDPELTEQNITDSIVDDSGISYDAQDDYSDDTSDWIYSDDAYLSDDT